MVSFMNKGKHQLAFQTKKVMFNTFEIHLIRDSTYCFLMWHWTSDEFAKYKHTYGETAQVLFGIRLNAVRNFWQQTIKINIDSLGSELWLPFSLTSSCVRKWVNNRDHPKVNPTRSARIEEGVSPCQQKCFRHSSLRLMGLFMQYPTSRKCDAFLISSGEPLSLAWKIDRSVSQKWIAEITPKTIRHVPWGLKKERLYVNALLVYCVYSLWGSFLMFV